MADQNNTRQPKQVESMMVSLTDAAKMLSIGRSTAWTLYREGKFPIPVVRIGSNLRVSRSRLAHFIETGESDVVATDSVAVPQ